MASIEKNSYEIYFEWWLEVLKQNGLVVNYEYQPEAFILKRVVPIFYEHKYAKKDPLFKDFNLFQPITYTTDYKVVFDVALWNKLYGIFFKDDHKMLSDDSQKTGNVYQNTLFYASEKGIIFEDNSASIKHVEMYFDVKPPSKAVQFSGKLGSSRDFKFNQRMVYDIHGIYVNKVVPIGTSTSLYAKTFTPNRYLYTDAPNSKILRTKQIKTENGKIKVPISELNDFRSFDEYKKLKAL